MSFVWSFGIIIRVSREKSGNIVMLDWIIEVITCSLTTFTSDSE